MFKKFREHKYLFAFTIFIFIAIFICILCNVAMEHQMTWLVFPVSSLVFGWGVCIPLIYGGTHGLKLSLGLLTALVLPYLLILEQWTGTAGWFVPIAFPIVLSGIIYVWAAYFILTRIGMLRWKAALLVLAAGILSFLCGLYLALVSQIDMFPWAWISFGSSVILFFMILYAGHIRSIQQ